MPKKILEIKLLRLKQKSEGLNFSPIHKDREASINPKDPPQLITKNFYTDRNVILREIDSNNHNEVQVGTSEVAVDYVKHFLQGMMTEEFSDITWLREKFWFTNPIESLGREVRETIHDFQKTNITYPFRNLRRFVQPPFGYLSEEEERVEKRNMLGWVFLVGLSEEQLQERIRHTDRRYDVMNNPDGRKKFYLGNLSSLHIGKKSNLRKMLRRCISQDWGTVITSESWNDFKKFKFRHSSTQLPGGPDLFHRIARGFAKKYYLPYENVEEKILTGTIIYHLIGMYYRPGSRTDTTICCSRSLPGVTVISKYQANQIMGTYKDGFLETNSFLVDVKDSCIDHIDKSFFIGEKKSGVVLAEIHYYFNEKQFLAFIDTLDVKREIASYKERSRFSDDFYHHLIGVIEIKDQFLVNLQNQPWIKRD
ncbi:MAG TPA: hypothetical protein PKV48_03105 [Thermodesulfobacteriota bacterium]|nr:hypothetical protein [Thermodesulfobacteriota bacterium]